MPWKKGQTGNPNGRPKTGKSHLDALEQAVKKHEAATGQNLWAHFVKQAFVDNKVLIALAKKLIPDKLHEQLEAQGGIQIVYVPPNDASPDSESPK